MDRMRAADVIPLVAPSYSPADKLLAQWDTDVQVRLFEEEFAEFVGCRGAVAVNSGTNALAIVLRALEIKAAWIQSYTCRAVQDACHAAETLSLLADNVCDIKRAQFGMIARENLAKDAVLSHMFGTRNPSPVPVPVEDITLSLGAVYAPHIAACSFHRDKMISTGRGGMIAADSEDLLERYRELAYYDQPRNGKYRPAFSFGMTGMQAALGRSQLRQLPGFIERRREIAARYTEVFSEVGIETPDRDVESVFFRYIVGVDDPAGKVVSLAEKGVEAGRGVDPPLHRLLGLPPEQFPGAEECWSKLLSVPVHPGLTDEQVEYITRQVVEVCAP